MKESDSHLLAFITLYKQKSDGTVAMLIPKTILAHLKLEVGDQCIVYCEKKEMRLKPVPKAKPTKESKQE